MGERVKHEKVLPDGWEVICEWVRVWVCELCEWVREWWTFDEWAKRGQTHSKPTVHGSMNSYLYCFWMILKKRETGWCGYADGTGTVPSDLPVPAPIPIPGPALALTTKWVHATSKTITELTLSITTHNHNSSWSSEIWPPYPVTAASNSESRFLEANSQSQSELVS